MRLVPDKINPSSDGVYPSEEKYNWQIIDTVITKKHPISHERVMFVFLVIFSGSYYYTYIISIITYFLWQVFYESGEDTSNRK